MQPGHYVTEYENLVRDLKLTLGHADAMSAAVGGGDFDEVGTDERRLIECYGFGAGKSLVDVGCGSGRLAKALGSAYGTSIGYLGLDIVEDLLGYARTVSPAAYEFRLNRELSLPSGDGSVDFVTFFSVFTHLLHEESFIYLRDSVRALKDDGKILFSFLEAKHQWPIFESEVRSYGNRTTPLVMFTEMPMIEAWTEHLGLKIVHYLAFDAPGQSIVCVAKQ